MLFELVEVTREFDATGLAAAASVNLGFDQPRVSSESAREFSYFAGAVCHFAALNRDAVVREEALGLVLVQIHKSPFNYPQCHPAYAFPSIRSP